MPIPLNIGSRQTEWLNQWSIAKGWEVGKTRVEIPDARNRILFALSGIPHNRHYGSKCRIFAD